MLSQGRSYMSDEESEVSSHSKGAVSSSSRRSSRRSSSENGGVDPSSGRTWQTSGDEALSRRSSSADDNLDASSVATWQRSLLQQPDLFPSDRRTSTSSVPGQVDHDALEDEACHGSVVPSERLRELTRHSRILSEESSKLKVDRDRLLMDNEELEAENDRLRALVRQHCVVGTDFGEERYESQEEDDLAERDHDVPRSRLKVKEFVPEPARGHFDSAAESEIEFSHLQEQLESAHLAQSASQDQVRRVSQMLEEAVEEAKNSSLEVESLRRQLAEQERKAAEWERQCHQERELAAALKAELERERRATANSHQSRTLAPIGEGILDDVAATDVNSSMEAADRAWKGLLRLL